MCWQAPTLRQIDFAIKAGWRQITERQLLQADWLELRQILNNEQKVKCFRRRIGLLFLSVVTAVLCWSTANLYQCQHKAFPKQTRVNNRDPRTQGQARVQL